VEEASCSLSLSLSLSPYRKKPNIQAKSFLQGKDRKEVGRERERGDPGEKKKREREREYI
jgi:hypothetical protein